MILIFFFNFFFFQPFSEESGMNLIIHVFLYPSGKLQVIYPEIVIDECSVIPKDFRMKISTVWEAPQILFADANKVRSVSVYFHLSAISNKF